MSSKLGVMDEEMEGEASELILFIFILKLLYNYSIYYSFLNCYTFILFNVFLYKGEQADLGRRRGLWRWEVQQINDELLPLVGIMKTFSCVDVQKKIFILHILKLVKVGPAPEIPLGPDRKAGHLAGSKMDVLH